MWRRHESGRRFVTANLQPHTCGAIDHARRFILAALHSPRSIAERHSRPCRRVPEVLQQILDYGMYRMLAFRLKYDRILLQPPKFGVIVYWECTILYLGSEVQSPEDTSGSQVKLGDLYTESGKALQGLFSAVSKPILPPYIRWEALAEIYTMLNSSKTPNCCQKFP